MNSCKAVNIEIINILLNNICDKLKPKLFERGIELIEQVSQIN